MGCNPAAPQAGGPDLATGLEATPSAMFNMLAGLVEHQDATAHAATFKAMAQRVGGPAGAAQARALAVRPEATSQLGALTMPALVLWGEQDALVPVAVGQTLAAALPRARFEVLAGCGHLPTLERAAKSAAQFAQLLDTVGPPHAEPWEDVHPRVADFNAAVVLGDGSRRTAAFRACPTV